MRTQGGGGVKKRSHFADVLYGWPLISTYSHQEKRLRELKKQGASKKQAETKQKVQQKQKNKNKKEKDDDEPKVGMEFV